MIDHAIKIVGERLSQHLAAQFALPDDFVAISPIVDGNGKPADEARNRIAMFLTNIQHDQMPRGAKRPSSGGDGSGQVLRSEPIHLDIYFMVAAAYDPPGYMEGLKLLSASLRFFQAQPVLTPRIAPEMPRGLEQLSIEICNVPNDAIGHLWGSLGGRYLPSVQFKMRSVMIDAGAVVDIAPVIRDPRQSARPAVSGGKDAHAVS